MHPAFLAFGTFHDHHHHKRGRCGHGHQHGHGGRPGGGRADEMEDDALGGGFGVRRPLRFLANQLGLDDAQIPILARILDELKTERAQAEVDRRRTVAAFADALAGEQFDESRASEGGQLRVGSAERLRDAVLNSLRQIHAVLTPEQRNKLAYLIRTGTLSL